jgi:hypothetical protein
MYVTRMLPPAVNGTLVLLAMAKNVCVPAERRPGVLNTNNGDLLPGKMIGVIPIVWVEKTVNVLENV